ncbi:uncharacterized protein BCN122_III0370 [Burkholderia cenocepacia]|nr:uncharacterized protein BCN122_III0370 [Burkholderia cenocepacia]
MVTGNILCNLDLEMAVNSIVDRAMNRHFPRHARWSKPCS